VRVTGRLKQDRWNSTDGKQHSKISIVAEHVEFKPEFKKEENPRQAISYAESAAETAEDYTTVDDGMTIQEEIGQAV
jgi:single-strand DNA-binding protein